MFSPVYKRPGEISGSKGHYKSKRVSTKKRIKKLLLFLGFRNLEIVKWRINQALTFTGIKNSRRGDYSCSVCGGRNIGMEPLPAYYFEQFQKYGHIHNIFFTETINLAQYSCRRCGASDRERLYALYFKNSWINNELVSLLDIAPANPLARLLLKRQRNIRYRSMDLSREDVDDRLDITDMNLYKDGQFDFVICSHVLEHVPDDLQAMKELFRILKRGGKGIIMAPINLQLKSILEDPACSDIPTRWRLFGQDDHLRLYSKQGFMDRLTFAGFHVEELGVGFFGQEQFRKYAIFPGSVLYIVSKL